ncbi:MAG: hypothetical protein QOI41_1957 [Myxococcales bacterium]|nr:hypothetical protein [Myxococcales bacterium]
MTNEHSETTLVRRTLRTVAMLVGACVLFVGALSVIAVAVTSRAVGAGRGDAKEAASEPSPTGKKPLSI